MLVQYVQKVNKIMIDQNLFLKSNITHSISSVVTLMHSILYTFFYFELLYNQ